jgi:omega-hydroxy-beta-dihydromenaquinone-9 sulfotransferase
LKAPQDTARLALLNTIFPGACFIHLVRDPQDLFASSVKMWRSMTETQALQTPDWTAEPALDDFVLETFERLYRNFDDQRRHLPAGQIIDVRYEDMTRDPAGTLKRIYAHFGWDEFDAAQAGPPGRGETARHYRLSPEIKAKVAARWGFYRERFGYSASRDVAA